MDEKERMEEMIPQDGYVHEEPDSSFYQAPRQRSTFANAAVVLSLAGFLSLFFPYAPLILGIMAILFGILALRRQESGRNRAIVGIVLGSCLVLLAGTLIICMSALAPYQDDLIRIFYEYMEHTY